MGAVCAISRDHIFPPRTNRPGGMDGLHAYGPGVLRKEGAWRSYVIACVDRKRDDRRYSIAWSESMGIVVFV